MKNLLVRTLTGISTIARQRTPFGTTLRTLFSLPDTQVEKQRTHAHFDLIEPRLLFSADPVTAAMPPPQVSNQAASQAMNQTVSTSASQTSTSHSTNTLELVVIDERVQQQDLLLQDIESQRASGRSIAVLNVGLHDDANQLLSNALEELRTGGVEVSAIHLISHGSSQGILLGQSAITAESLRSNANSIAQWSLALTADADILIYGCDLGTGSSGRELVNSLAALTGADVAANNETTGSAALGGDWTLQYQTGSIEAQVAISPTAQAQWQHLLATVTYQFPPTLAHVSTNGNQATSTTTDPVTAMSGGANRRVAVDAKGNFVVTWQDIGTNTAYYRVFNANGTARTADLTVTNSGFGNTAEDSSVAMAADGTFVIVWTQFNGSTNSNVYLQQFDANGGRIGGAPTQVSDEIPNRAVHASVAINTDKDIVVTWEAFDQTILSIEYYSIYAQAFQWTGATAISAEFRVNTFTGTSSQSRPSVAIQGNRATTVWQSETAPFLGGFDIKLRSFDLDGANLSTTKTVNDVTADNQILPDVAVAANGDIFIAWQQNDSGLDSVHAQLLDASLNDKGSERVLSLASGNATAMPQVAASPDGTLYLVYQSPNEDGSGLAVLGIIIDSAGQTSGLSNLFADNGGSSLSGDQYAPSVAFTGGKAITAWTGQGSNPGNVFVRSTQLTPPAVTVTATGATTSEAGTTVTLSVRLATQPAGLVTVGVQSSDYSESILNRTSLSFDSSNWWITQTITVTGKPDGVIDGNQNYTISFTTASTVDTSYNALAVSPVSLSNTDIDFTRHEITVDTNSDVVDGNTGSLATLFFYKGGDGKISLREAIIAANNTLNETSGPDAIYFDLPIGTIISSNAAELNITNALIIDGTKINSATANPIYNATSLQPIVTITGTLANASGLVLSSGSDGSSIKGLAIVGFSEYGVAVYSSGNTIQYNYIGVNHAGTIAQANAQGGILLQNSSGNTVSTNVISGNGGKVIGSTTYGSGIDVNNSSNNLITTNKIGTDASGTVALGNITQGIRFDGTGTNVSSNNLVRNNIIGGNNNAGIRMAGLGADANFIYGNWIGTNGTGMNIGNGNDGVAIQDGSSGNRIGGAGAGDGNTIAFNANHGVHAYVSATTINSTSDNAILGNSIYSNGGLGIDLAGWNVLGLIPAGDSIVNPNDGGDLDAGANGLVNFPIISGAASDATTTRVNYAISGAALTYYRVEFFSSPSVDGTGYGEGKIFLGYANVFSNSSGDASLTSTLSAPATPSTYITATATITDSSYTASGSTSEFSRAMQVVSAPQFVANVALTPLENTITSLNTAQASVLLSGLQPGMVFSLVNNADIGRFTINSTTGLLRTTSNPDFEALPLEAWGSGDTVWLAIVRVTDTFGYSAETEVSFEFQDVNESPSITAPNTITSQEDAVISFAGINAVSISDPDAGTTNDSTPINVTATLSEGTLVFSSTAGVTVSFAGGSWMLSGNLSSVNIALQSMSYQPVANSSNNVTLDLSVSDQGSGLGTAETLSANRSINISQAAVNDAPLVTLPTNYSVPFASDTMLGSSAAMQISDVDSASLPVTLTVSVQNGTLKLGVGASSNTFTLTDSIANAQTKLNQLVYTPNTGFSGNDTLTVTVNDQGNVGSGTANLSNNSTTISVASNSTPVVSGQPAAINFVENGAALTIAPGIAISDIDSSTIVAADIQISSGYSPLSDSITLSAALPPGFTAVWDSANTELKITGTGTLSQYEQILRTAQFNCVGDDISPITRVIAFHLSDGNSWSANALTQITVTSVNDGPTLTAPTQYTAPFAGTIRLGTAAASSITVSDPDAGTSFISADVTVSSGTISLSNQSGISIASGNASGDTRLVFVGEIADVQNALNNIDYSATPGFAGNDLLVIVIDDLGSNGTGGAHTARSDIQITVQASALPIISNSNNSVTFTENSAPIKLWPQLNITSSQSATLNSAYISFQSGYQQGVDQLAASAGGSIAVQWNAATGVLELSGSATRAEYNAAIRSITFANASESPSTVNRALRLVVSDQFTSSAPSNLMLSVNAVNDAPVLAVSASVSGFEDTALIFGNGLRSSIANDVDSSLLRLGIQIDKGTLAWSGTGTLPSGVQQVSPQQFQLSGSASSINRWARQIELLGPSNFNGNVLVQWTLQDNGSPALQANAVTTVLLASVNDIPAFNGSQPLNLTQGRTVAITPDQASATDVETPANQLQYRLLAGPAQGTLLLNGIALGANANFTQDHINSGLVTYRHNGSFDAADQIRFEVIDSGGASSGEKILTINIQAAPVVIAAGTGTAPTTAAPGSNNTPSAAAVDVKTVSQAPTPDTSTSGLSAPNVSTGAATAAVNTSASQKLSTRSSGGNINSSSNDAKATDVAFSGQFSLGAATALALNNQVDKGIAKNIAPTIQSSTSNETPRGDPNALSSTLRSRNITENIAASDAVVSAITNRSFIESVEKVREEVVSNKMAIDRNIVASSTAVSASLSIGYVIWLVRGGALLSSLLASLPAWRMVDPLPVLGSMGEQDDSQDDESLGSMIDKSKAAKDLHGSEHSHRAPNSNQSVETAGAST